jgi:hypothetical protein
MSSRPKPSSVKVEGTPSKPYIFPSRGVMEAREGEISASFRKWFLTED